MVQVHLKVIRMLLLERQLKGDIICIIEAMKVMNEIKAPCDGTVTSILVENEALVEYDQALMVIEENV